MSLPTFLLVFSIFYSCSAVPVSPHRDKVISLPGAPLFPEFNLFSGYLNGSSNALAIPIFYVLSESIRVDPSSAPLVLWFNGGPGGSSLAGFFLEHGPYRVTEKGDVLTYNEFSWNQYANVLYLESPLGVGFSQNSEGNMTMNDFDAAEINFNALRDFMSRVHTNYSDRDYFLSGQSYAGAFVPYLARRLLVAIEKEEMTNSKFKGFAIGNPVFDWESEFLDQSMQFLSYGLLPLEYTEVIMINWLKHQRGEEINYTDLNELAEIQYEDIAEYKIGRNSPIHYNFIEHCYTRNHSDQDYHGPTEKKSIACYGHDAVETYLNRVDAQTALHIHNISAGTNNWTMFNPKIGKHFRRDKYLLPEYNDIFSHLNGSSFRILIYHGDTDVVLSPVHTIASTSKIAADNSLENEGYDKAWRFYGDFAGMRTGYRNRNTTMDVLTVRGSGHSVPTDLPAQSFQIINNFLFSGENNRIDYSAPIRKRSNINFTVNSLVEHSLDPGSKLSFPLIIVMFSCLYLRHM